ncbi:MAG: hypothetical protein V1734_07040 [Nanoarchaeota archaeon]
MDHILGEEIVRIADDEPRFPYRSGKTLDDEELNTRLKLSRYGITIEDPSKPWGYDEKGKVKIKDGRLEKEN